jgi:hypothetical protein
MRLGSAIRSILRRQLEDHRAGGNGIKEEKDHITAISWRCIPGLPET